MKNLQPALHRKLIKEGKMTAEESQRIVNEWIFQENTNKQMKVIEDSLEERDAMGMEAEERQTEDMMEGLSQMEHEDPSEDYKNN